MRLPRSIRERTVFVDSGAFLALLDADDFQRPFWSASVSADACAEAKTSALHNLFYNALENG